MANIISSDFFRLRKGKTIKGVLIGIICVLLVTAVLLKVFSSDWFLDRMINTSTGTSGFGISMELDESDLQDLEQLQVFEVHDGTEYMASMMSESAELLLVLILPFIIAVFGGDYASGAFRNLLSYHSKRKNIYIAKLLTTSIVAVLLTIAFEVLSWLTGTVFFGFGNSIGLRLVNMLPGTLLMLPRIIDFISIGQGVIAFTKKTGTTIAIYLIGMICWALVIQVVAMFFPGVSWIMNLDLTTMLGLIFDYTSLSLQSILTPTIFSIIIIAVTTIAGM
mgnify:CR=1 FL=1